MCTLLQAMMLLDNRYEGYEFASISADEIMRYASHIKKNYSDAQRERLYDIIDYLEKVFPEKEKLLKKINIPIVMLAADTAMGDQYDPVKNCYRVGPMYFRHWFISFFEESYEEYKQYCSSGSIKKEKTLKRIAIMEGSLKKYFELGDADNAEPAGQDTSLTDDSNPLLDADSCESDPASDKTENSPVIEETEEDTASADDGTGDNPSSLSEAAEDNPSSVDGSAESNLSPATDDTEDNSASAIEGTGPYTASEQTGTIETDGEEKPPEEVDQETE